MSSQAGTREVAYRLFAAEYDDADLDFSESDEERAPNYVITPSGGRVNRLFLVGVLTELDRVNEEMLRARVVDPTGGFVVYAGQYQPDELAFLESIEPPTFLAVTGKARTFQPDDSDRVYTSVRPESISEVDADTRDRWVVDTARRTLERISVTATGIETGLDGADLREALESEGVDPSLAQGVTLALDHYDTTPAYLDALRKVAIEAAQVVANEREEVEPLTLAPDEGGGDTSMLAGLATDTGIASAGGASAADHEAADTIPDTDSQASPGEAATEQAATPVDTTETGSGASVEPGEIESAAEEAEELGDFDETFDPDEEVLDQSERQEIEDEYGTEFSTGTDVDPDSGSVTEISEPGPGSAEAEPGPANDDTHAPEPASASASDSTDDSDDSTEREPAPEDDDTIEEVDPQDAVLEMMAELDDGDGAARDAVVERAAEEYGLDVDVAEDAIEDAMMSGKAYEPDEGKVKPI